MSSIKKSLNSILNILVTIMIILLFVSVISNFQTSFLGKKYNNIFGYALFEIKTASMSGTMEINDWILVKITDDIKVDDIITFEQDGSFTTHRVIQIYKDAYITKGDSNTTTDVPVDKSQIVGKLVKVLPKLGIIKKTILNPTVLILFILTIILGNSLFVKEESSLKEKVGTWFGKEELKKTNKKKETKKETKKEDNKELEEAKKYALTQEELKKYPQLAKLKDSKDLSKTIVLSKIKVNKKNNNLETIKQIKEQLKEEETQKKIEKQKKAKVVDIN